MATNNGINNIDKFSMNVVRYATVQSGTYIPTTSMKYIIVEMCGSGGGSGGTSLTASSGAIRVAAPGGAGNYLKFMMTAAQVGSSLSYSLGSGGTAGASTPTNGGNGGDAVFGNWTAAGGVGSALNSTNVGSQTVTNNTNTIGTGVLILSIQSMSWSSYANNVGATVMAWGLSPGGSNPLNTAGSTYTGLLNVSGSGASSLFGSSTQGPGSGGQGRGSYNQSTGAVINTAGAAGSVGIIIVTEFIQN
ncbi:hypothetical protein [Legionella maceachernii]|uniref:Uncharacterized protein n=1 Tax=Legionella maceachernii TaxID=466 RepID=A0A0W0WBD8_9GAMM|nr:hypothetical protein [Legionella maceachernii]KTD29660.1 hypothetical protein Lmac_0835 [Legionella maceachernii]SKA20906.1 hypothetical protein SAMN02745128_02578 [Legionella maceachernii]SUP02628.1 Uncharacterised protein [Legionella maceachernii]